MVYSYSLFVCHPRDPKVPWVFIASTMAGTQEAAMGFFRGGGLLACLEDIEEEYIITFR